MKILYSIGPRPGAAQQLEQFLIKSSELNWEVKTAGFYHTTKPINYLNWTLDNLSNKTKILLQKDIEEYNPDLVICDGEKYIANIAANLKLKLWYVSSLLLVGNSEFPWKKSFYHQKFDKLIKWLDTFPVAEKYLICSPFHFLNKNEKFIYCEPYLGVNNNQNIFGYSNDDRVNLFLQIKNNYKLSLPICFGESGNVSFLLKQKKPFIVCPSLNDLEGILNANICQFYNLGINLGQLELANKFIDTFINQRDISNLESIEINEEKKLHQILSEIS